MKIANKSYSNLEPFQWHEIADTLINFIEVFNEELGFDKIYTSRRYTFNDGTVFSLYGVKS